MNNDEICACGKQAYCNGDNECSLYEEPKILQDIFLEFSKEITNTISKYKDSLMECELNEGWYQYTVNFSVKNENIESIGNHQLLLLNNEEIKK